MAILPGKLAWQGCSHEVAWQVCLAGLLGALRGRAVRQCCWQHYPANLLGRVAQGGCMTSLFGRIARSTAWQGGSAAPLGGVVWQGCSATLLGRVVWRSCSCVLHCGEAAQSHVWTIPKHSLGSALPLPPPASCLIDVKPRCVQTQECLVGMSKRKVTTQ